MGEHTDQAILGALKLRISDAKFSISSYIYGKLDQGERELIRNLEEKNVKLKQSWVTAKWFKSNKISGEYLSSDFQWINAQRLYRLKWFSLFKSANRLLQDKEINHVFVKCLNVEYPLVADVDLLIENPIEVLKAVEALKSQGFALYEMDRVIRPALKITAKNPEYMDVNLDIYTEPAWDTFRFQDKCIITKKSKIEDIYGLSVCLPSWEDDLILVSTHALSHGRFTVGEVLHGARILSEHVENFDWEYVHDRAQRWAIHEALYLYFLLVEGYCEVFKGSQVVPSDVILRLQSHYSSRAILRWLIASSRMAFPLLLPVRLLYTVALLRGAKLLKKGRNPLGDLTRVSLERLSGVLTRELGLS